MRRARFILFIQTIIIIVLTKRFLIQINENSILHEKLDRQIIVARKWIKLGGSYWKIVEYLQDINVYYVAIYGMGFLGEQLYQALRKTGNIEVVYGLDKNAENLQCELPMYTLDSFHISPKKPDAIIVSNVYSCGSIVKSLRKRYVGVKIILLEEILDYIIF